MRTLMIDALLESVYRELCLASLKLSVSEERVGYLNVPYTTDPSLLSPTTPPLGGAVTYLSTYLCDRLLTDVANSRYTSPFDGHTNTLYRNYMFPFGGHTNILNSRAHIRNVSVLLLLTHEHIPPQLHISFFDTRTYSIILHIY